MKLKKIIENIDPIGDVIIWTQEDDEESGPSYKGSILDIPWWMLKCKIGRVNDTEEPMYLCFYTNKNGVKLPALVINIIAE